MEKQTIYLIIHNSSNTVDRKMIRRKQVTKYFKRRGLKKIRENNTRKASKVSFQTLWFEKILQNEMFLLCHPRGKQA
jgi:hypothetical protein